MALIHFVAKEYAQEATERVGLLDPQIEIEELTDPPFSESEITDGRVIILFSYAG